MVIPLVWWSYIAGILHEIEVPPPPKSTGVIYAQTKLRLALGVRVSHCLYNISRVNLNLARSG